MAAPINDNFADALEISGTVGFDNSVTDNSEATVEIDEPFGSNWGSSEPFLTVWYKWICPESGDYLFETTGSLNVSDSGVDTVLGIWQGSSVSTLSEIASDSQLGGDNTSSCRFSGSSGQTYYVQVGVYSDGETGSYVLGWSKINSSLPNDNFADFILLSGNSGRTEAIIIDSATTEVDEPVALNGPEFQTIWYKWIAPVSGNTTFSTRPSYDSTSQELDTKIAIWTGSNFADLVEIVSGDDDPDLGTYTSFVSFQSSEGQDYWIQIGAYSEGAEGGIVLLWSLPPAPTGFQYQWVIKHYDIDGSPTEANYSGYSHDVTSEEIFHATNRTLNFYLNGVDDCSFTLYLDDPMAYLISPLKSIIKVWRTIRDQNGYLIYQDEEDAPSFCGVVGYTIKDGDSNTMQIKAFNPQWRLQFHFHLLNHYLLRNPDTSNNYLQSELMWKLIDLINNAFGVNSFTGIAQGLFDWSGEPEIAPYFVAKGSNTWSNIFDDIMNRAAGSDIWPRYFHNDYDPILMYFDTFEKRGQDKTSDIKFNYHTGDADNLENLTEEIQAIPNEFANYLWAVGQGGPNAGKVAMAENNSGASGSWGYNEVGVYMKTVDRREIKRLSALQPIADAELAQSKIPKYAYSITVSPASGIFYGDNMDYMVGDVVELNADKNALYVSQLPQRIYQCSLAMSENNVETSSPLIANDFYGKVEGT
jgi:hypothetical protein